MSDAYLVRRGGSGGLSPNSAVIHVTAPAGSSVSFAKGGVVAKVLGPDKSHVKASDSAFAEWYYAVSPDNYGEWTVNAIRQSDQETESKTVTISENKQYDLEIIFRFYLFREGYGLTSGYSISYSTNGGSGAGGSSNLNRINLTYTASFAIKPSVDIKDYTLLCFNVASLYLDAQNRCRIALSTDGAIWNGGINSGVADKWINDTGVTSSDISAYSGSYYAAGRCAGNSWINISDIYLSK